MPRIPRRALVEPGSTHHCTFRSHNGVRLFEDPQVAEYFLSVLAEEKERYGIRVHSYVLMGTHPHVVLTAQDGQAAFSEFWKVVNWKLARFFNQREGRCGQVVMERMKSPAISPDERHQLTVMRYGDLNPVRAGLVKSPKEWRYSSYRYYAFGENNPLIDPAPDYLALGASPATRRLAYRGLFALSASRELRVRRPEFTRAAFIGPPWWVRAKLEARGLSRAAGPPD